MRTSNPPGWSYRAHVPFLCLCLLFFRGGNPLFPSPLWAMVGNSSPADTTPQNYPRLCKMPPSIRTCQASETGTPSGSRATPTAWATGTKASCQVGGHGCMGLSILPDP